MILNQISTKEYESLKAKIKRLEGSVKSYTHRKSRYEEDLVTSKRHLKSAKTNNESLWFENYYKDKIIHLNKQLKLFNRHLITKKDLLAKELNNLAKAKVKFVNKKSAVYKAIQHEESLMDPNQKYCAIKVKSNTLILPILKHRIFDFSYCQSSTGRIYFINKCMIDLINKEIFDRTYEKMSKGVRSSFNIEFNMFFKECCIDFRYQVHSNKHRAKSLNDMYLAYDRSTIPVPSTYTIHNIKNLNDTQIDNLSSMLKSKDKMVKSIGKDLVKNSNIL